MVHKLFHRLRTHLQRKKIEREMEAELRFHLEMEAEENIRRGMSEDEARLTARRNFGGVAQVKEAYRDVSRFRWIEDIGRDLGFGVRMLLKHPGFTAVVVLTLALGIGVNTAIFTFFNIYLRPLPIKDPEMVVHLKYQGEHLDFSYLNYVYLRDNTQVFSDLIAHCEEGDLLEVKSAAEEPEEVAGEFVSDNFFSVLGGSVVLGRTFTPEENRVPGRDQVVVLSHHFWQRRFAGDPNVVGQTLRLDGKPFTVIGVLGREFAGFNLEIPDIWLPLMTRGEVHTWNVAQGDWFGKRSLEWLRVSGRLKPGRTIEEANAEMQLLSGQLARAYPEIKPRESIRAVSSARLAQGNESGKFLMVIGIPLAATGIVLLIACSNVANLLLSRAATRRKEIGVRLCLGASRSRVIRQLLTESFLLAGLGGIAGLLLTRWSVELLAALFVSQSGKPDPASVALDFSPDVRILGFTILVSLASGLAFGLAPALQATRADLAAAIKDEGAGFGRRLDRSRLRNGLVVAQVALCLVLLIPAGLLLRAVLHALTLDPGFETERLLVVRYNLELSGFDKPREQLFRQQLMERLASLPGVEQVSAMGEGSIAYITLPGEREGADRRFGRAPYTVIPPNILKPSASRSCAVVELPRKMRKLGRRPLS